MSIGHILLCLYLILAGLVALISTLTIPAWVLGVLALSAGIVLVLEGYNVVSSNLLHR